MKKRLGLILLLSLIPGSAFAKSNSIPENQNPLLKQSYDYAMRAANEVRSRRQVCDAQYASCEQGDKASNAAECVQEFQECLNNAGVR